MFFSKKYYTSIPTSNLIFKTAENSKKNFLGITFIQWKKNLLTQKRTLVKIETEGIKLDEYSVFTEGKIKSDIPNQILIDTELKQIKIIYTNGRNT